MKTKNNKTLTFNIKTSTMNNNNLKMPKNKKINLHQTIKMAANLVPKRKTAGPAPSDPTVAPAEK